MDVVVGAGMGGLAAAIRLARAGRRVLVLEARDRVGGLAAGLDVGDYHEDGGPYVLLDRPGLTWALERLGVDPGPLDLLPLREVYRVERPNRPTFHLYADLDETVAHLEATWPGSGLPYRRWVGRMARIYENLRPIQAHARPGPGLLLRKGLIREGLFLLRDLGAHLRGAGLPADVVDGLAIWTHLAGQPIAGAPAPMAFVPAIVHTHGAWVVRGGMRRIPELLEQVARALGVEIRTGAPVERIVRDGRRVVGVDTGGERIVADRVVSDVGLGTYLALLDPPAPALSAELARLPLQSPGVGAWLRVDADPLPFLTFHLPTEGPPRLRIAPGAVDPTRAGHLRLLGPVDHEWAERVGPEGQARHLDAILAEPWWRVGVRSAEVVLRRTPADWGREHHLWRDGMNPVMTASFMRQGRLPHRSPVADGLFLCGASTHPGQWVSFCAISGVLAADAAMEG